MKYTKIVWDGVDFNCPCEIGNPREDQLQGSNLDNIVETAGRICYDSIGTGRNSKDYHKHIIEVGHGSVWEHANLTFSIWLDIPNYLSACEALLNRPGIWITKEVPTLVLPGQKPGFILRFTANLRSIRDWFKYPPLNKMAVVLGKQVQFLAHKEAPLVLSDLPGEDCDMPLAITSPKYQEETWVSFLITNVSRGFSHELVRHKYGTAVSQRSTRYVDESKSEWCWHPLINKYLTPKETLFHNCDYNDVIGTKFNLQEIESLCKQGYESLVAKLQEKLVSEGIDKFTSRKQARGAARGMLGNALFTEMIFSANIAQWKWIIQLRSNAAADAEIRVVTNEIYDILNEKYPDHFKGWTKTDCPDGLGFAVSPPKIVDQVG